MFLFLHLFLLATPRMYKMYQVNDRASFPTIAFLEKNKRELLTICFFGIGGL